MQFCLIHQVITLGPGLQVIWGLHVKQKNSEGEVPAPKNSDS